MYEIAKTKLSKKANFWEYLVRKELLKIKNLQEIWIIKNILKYSKILLMK